MHIEDPRQIKRDQLSQFTDRPIYFFDTRYLLANAKALADWNPTRLEAAISPRVEHVLGTADHYVAVQNGFYVIFGSRAVEAAREKADAICADILTHFYGPAGHAPHIDRLRRPASVEDMGKDLGIVPPSERQSGRPSRAVHPNPDTADSEAEQFANELKTLFRRHCLAMEKEGASRFSPIWDSRKGRVTAFACGLDTTPRDAATPEHTPGAAQCRADVAVLAAAVRGARHVTERGDVALISVPVHAETLSWSKTRAAYIDVLGLIDSRALALIAPRIVGLHAGSNLSDVAQWGRALRRHAHWVFVHLPSADIDVSRAGLLGVTGFGITARPITNDGHSLEALGQQAAKLANLCFKQNAVAFAYDVASTRELFLLKRKGVRFMAGPVIGPAEDLPSTAGEIFFPEVA
ncbi:MAG TPA: hypothetical protein VEU06_05875 [Micropepsaceae bacterium]|nr:hypothetical protein [Micropepsaceae bacterium]